MGSGSSKKQKPKSAPVTSNSVRTKPENPRANTINTISPATKENAVDNTDSSGAADKEELNKGGSSARSDKTRSGKDSKDDDKLNNNSSKYPESDSDSGEESESPKSSPSKSQNNFRMDYNKSPPPPKPAKSRKDEVFKLEDYKYVDDYIEKAPKKLLFGTFRDLVNYITADEDWSDMAKVRAVFRWVTSIDVYNLKVEADPPQHSPLEYFVKIQKNEGNHAHLFSGVCQMAGLPCVIVSGMNKSAAYQIGRKVERKAMGAQWNAVYVSGDWRFVDGFWASACVIGKKSSEWTLIDTDGNVTEENSEESEGETTHRINEFYFLPDADQIIWTHYPDEQKWQLLQKPVSVKMFEEHFYVRERFHMLGMGVLPSSQMKCVLNAKEGEVSIPFSIPPEHSYDYRFKYMLYKSRANSDGERSILLDRFVFFEHAKDFVEFSIRFPVKGSFKMDVFALNQSEPDAIFDLACTYLIEAPKSKNGCMPLPDCPPLGWGPNHVSNDAGITPISHDTALIKTKDGNVEIRFSAEKDIQMFQSLKHALLSDAVLSNYSLTRLEGDEAIIKIRLPQGGEYALKVFVNDKGQNGEAPNVCNYLIQSEGGDMQPFPNVPDGTLGPGTMAKYFGVVPVSHPGGLLDAKDGRAEVKFKANKNVELLCEIHSSDPEACKLMKVGTTNSSGEWVFDIDVPKKGEYSLNVFAREKGKDAAVFNVHSYLVDSTGRDLSDEEKAKLAEDEVDGGQTIEVETINTSDKEVMIPIPQGCTAVMASLQRRNAKDPPNFNKFEKVSFEDDDYFNVHMKEYGEYAFNIYNKDDSGKLKLVARYQINRKTAGDLEKGNVNLLMAELGAEKDKGKNSSKGGGKKDELKGRIQKAIDLKDVDGLERALNDYEAAFKKDDDPLFRKGKRMLAVFKAKQELNDASQKRDIDALDKAITKAKKVNFDRNLDLNIAMASKLLEHLRKLEKLRHAVLALDQRTIAELKGYSAPPAGIHEVMAATFLLLGSSKKDVKQWKSLQALMGKTGKESLMRKVSQFDPKDITLDISTNAKKQLADFTTDDIRDKSAGAATFYLWSTGMIDEVENCGGAGPGETKRPKTTKSAKKSDKGQKSNKQTTKSTARPKSRATKT